MQSTTSINDLLRQAKEALRKNSKDSNLHQLIAPVYETHGRYQEALQHLAFLLSSQARPEEELYLRYAYAQQRTGAFPAALQTLTAGLAQHPQSKLLQNSLATNYMLLGQYEKAREAYLQLHAQDPADSHSIGMAGAMALLISGHKQGFRDYAARPREEREANLFAQIAEWKGEGLAGKSIICWTEQGIGDAIMFIGLVPYLLAQKAKVTLAVNLRLQPLLARGMPEAEVVYSSDQISARSFDYQISLGGLMEYVLPHYQPAAHAPYLKPDADKVRQLRERYQAMAQQQGRSRLVGLAWHTTNYHIGYIRNIALSEMSPLFSVPDTQFICLQYGDHAQEIAEVNRQFKDMLRVDPDIDAFNDLDGLAAQMMALDEVVTIDNATVHLAGAIGVRTTLLVPACPDWRWKQEGESNSWYGSVRLLRQQNLLNWKPVIKKVRACLLEK